MLSRILFRFDAVPIHPISIWCACFCSVQSYCIAICIGVSDLFWGLFCFAIFLESFVKRYFVTRSLVLTTFVVIAFVVSALPALIIVAHMLLSLTLVKTASLACTFPLPISCRVFSCCQHFWVRIPSACFHLFGLLYVLPHSTASSCIYAFSVGVWTTIKCSSIFLQLYH